MAQAGFGPTQTLRRRVCRAFGTNHRAKKNQKLLRKKYPRVRGERKPRGPLLWQEGDLENLPKGPYFATILHCTCSLGEVNKKYGLDNKIFKAICEKVGLDAFLDADSAVKTP